PGSSRCSAASYQGRCAPPLPAGLPVAYRPSPFPGKAGGGPEEAAAVTHETASTGADGDSGSRDRDRPRIYAACLAAYNSGYLHGRWIDATRDPEGIQAEVSAMLR